MYKNEFEQLIKNKLPNYFLLFGNQFFIDFYQKILKKKLNAETLSLYFQEYDFNLAKTHIQIPSLFGDKNALFIKTDKILPSNEIKTLIKISQKTQNYFFYFYVGDKFQSLTKIFKSNFVRFFEPNYNESIFFLTQKAKLLNIEISNMALNHLYQLTKDISLALKELEKLSVLDKITIEDINSLVYPYHEDNFEEVFNLILEKKEFLKEIAYLLKKDDEIKILSAFLRYVKQLFLFFSFIKINGYASSQEILGYKLPKQIEDKRTFLAIKIKEKTYLELFNILTKAELDIKTSKDKTAIFYSSLLQIKSIL